MTRMALVIPNFDFPNTDHVIIHMRFYWLVLFSQQEHIMNTNK